MTYQTEFPDYPADAIPALGEGWRDWSWRNEPCPSFIHEESGVALYCDWPDASQREHEGASHYEFVQMANRDPVHGWQHGDGDHPELTCDTIGEVRDLLDSLPYSASMADALQSARMRLNQLTADDARALIAAEIAFGEAGGKACPDLIGAMRQIIACADGMHSWIDQVGALPPSTRCDHCGETYGEPS